MCNTLPLRPLSVSEIREKYPAANDILDNFRQIVLLREMQDLIANAENITELEISCGPDGCRHRAVECTNGEGSS